MRILLFETTQYQPCSPLFLDALRESGHEFAFFDEAPFVRPLARSLLHQAGYRLLGRRPLSWRRLNRELIDRAVRFGPDAVLVVKGPYIAARTLAEIRARTGARLINYATDDPFNPANRTRDLADSIACYDLYASPRRAVIPDLRRAGCQRPIYLPFGYQPGVHFPEAADERFRCDVVFLGGADADRIPWFEELARIPGLHLSLYGGYWSGHPALRACARGFARGREYRLALAGAKIAIGLVRRANRDGHSMRTFEIPACGAFLLAERTEEHLELFEEGREAVFFDSPEELADKTRFYLRQDAARARIAEAGRRRVAGGGHSYASRLAALLEAVRQ